MFDAAIAAVAAERVVPPALPEPPAGRTIVIGAGKAAAAMAAAVERHWPTPLDGLVVTPYGHAVPCTRVTCLEAAHPLPDEAGAEAARRLLGLVAGLTADDLVLALVSGGASSLLALPAAGVSAADERALGAALLRSGAPIAAVNQVRKHVSAVKGGRLAAAAWPAAVVTLLVSDVPGDDPAAIGSGPTVADPSTYAEALEVLERYEVAAPPGVVAHLRAGAAGGPGAPGETPKPGDERLARASHVIVATAATALSAAAAAARAVGLRPILLGDAIEGEAREVGLRHAQHAIDLLDWSAPGEPTVLLSGGETTVTVRGGGMGGRNTEYLAGLALGLEGRAGVAALAADTDGIDGRGGHAGAFIDPDTLERAGAAGLDVAAALRDNDTGTLFARLGDLLATGPTRTNVNDFRAILVELA
jgi:hydroxypyruvate reductase